LAQLWSDRKTHRNGTLWLPGWVVLARHE
jgi:hypothetical protein